MPISGAARPAGDSQSDQSNSDEAAHDNADTEDFCVKQQPDDERGNNQQR